MARLRRWAGRLWLAGQIGVTAFVAKAEQILQCFQDRGALAARFYKEDQPNSPVPKVGAVMVINQSRITQELINCALGGQEGQASAQSLNIEPCASAGTITYQGDTISYVYAGSHPRCLQSVRIALRESGEVIGGERDLKA